MFGFEPVEPVRPNARNQMPGHRDPVGSQAGGTQAGRCHVLEPVEIRLHSTTLYNSIYLSDETMLVNMHMYGSGAPSNPVMHLQRVAGGRLFESYRRSVESVWEVAVPTTEL